MFKCFLIIINKKAKKKKQIKILSKPKKEKIEQKIFIKIKMM